MSKQVIFLEDSALKAFMVELLESAEEEALDEEELDEEELPEVSVAGAIGGVTTPLGTGPRFPNPELPGRMSPEEAAGKSFGNAKPAKKRKRKSRRSK